MNIKKLAMKFLVKQATTPSLDHTMEINSMYLSDYSMDIIMLGNKLTPQLKQEMAKYKSMPEKDRVKLKTGICAVIYNNEESDSAIIKLRSPILTGMMPPNRATLNKKVSGTSSILLTPAAPVTKEEFFKNVQAYLNTAGVTFLSVPSGSLFK